MSHAGERQLSGRPQETRASGRNTSSTIEAMIAGFAVLAVLASFFLPGRRVQGAGKPAIPAQGQSAEPARGQAADAARAGR